MFSFEEGEQVLCKDDWLVSEIIRMLKTIKSERALRAIYYLVMREWRKEPD